MAPREMESLETSVEGVSAQSHGQLARRAAHLEADLALLRQRKIELERENEVLSATAVDSSQLAAELAEVEASADRYEAECLRHRAGSERCAELEQKQAEIARSFSELQGVVSQLVKRLGDLDAQRLKLCEERDRAEAVVSALRGELFKAKQLGGIGAAPAESRGKSQGAVRRTSSTGSLHGPSGRNAAASGGAAAVAPAGGASPCRLRCRVEPATGPRGLSVPRGRRLAQPMPSQMLELAEARIECEILRQRLITEELATAQAREGAKEMHSESTRAEARTTVLQSELRSMLATWAPAADDEALPLADDSSPTLQRAASAGASPSRPYVEAEATAPSPECLASASVASTAVSSTGMAPAQ